MRLNLSEYIKKCQIPELLKLKEIINEELKKQGYLEFFIEITEDEVKIKNLLR